VLSVWVTMQGTQLGTDRRGEYHGNTVPLSEQGGLNEKAAKQAEGNRGDPLTQPTSGDFEGRRLSRRATTCATKPSATKRTEINWASLGEPRSTRFRPRA
jgi:hypothetical protein